MPLFSGLSGNLYFSKWRKRHQRMRELARPIAPSVRRTVIFQGLDLRQTVRRRQKFSVLEKGVPNNAHRKEPEKNGADAVEPERELWAGQTLGAGSGDPAVAKMNDEADEHKKRLKHDRLREVRLIRADKGRHQ